MADIFEQENQTNSPIVEQGDIFDRVSNNPTIETIKSNAALASDFNPEMEAKAIRLSQGLNVPWELVRGKEHEFEKARSGPNPYFLVSNAPRTADYYKRFDAMSVSYDDSENLKNVETKKKNQIPELTIGRVAGRFWNDLKRSLSERAAGNVAVTESYDPENQEDVNRYYRTLTSVEAQETYKLVSEYMNQGVSEPDAKIKAMLDRLKYHRDYWENIKNLPSLQEAEEYRGKSSGFIEDVSGGIGGSAIGMATTALSPAVGAADIIQQMFGGKAEELKKKGYSPKVSAEAAKISALGQSPLEFAGHLIKLNFLKKAFRPGSAKEFLISLVESAAGEGLEEYIQTFPDKYADLKAQYPNISQQELINKFADQVPDIATSEEAYYSAAIGATIGAIFPLAGRATGATVDLVNKSIESKQFSANFDEIKEAVEATNTKQRSPEMTEVYLDNLDLGDVYLSADGVLELFQSSPEFASDLLTRAGIDPKRAQELAAQGNDVKTSLSKIHSYLTPEEQDQLRPDLKPAPSALTERETESVDIQKEADKIGEQVRDYTEKQKTLQQVRNNLKKQIVEAGYKPKYADDAIALTEAFADRMSLDGLDKEAFLKKISVTAKATDQDGISYNQSGEIEQNENFKRWFGDSKVVDESGKPLVVYHGTRGDIKEFGEKFLGKNTKAESAKRGFFFTSSPKVASGYSSIGPTRREHELRNKLTKMVEESKYDFPISQDKEIRKIYDELSRIEMEGDFEATKETRLIKNEKEKAEDALWDLFSKSKYKNYDEFYNNVNTKEVRRLKEKINRYEYRFFNFGSNVAPVYLSLQNPIIKDYKGEEYREVSYNELLKQAKQGGNDGAIFLNTYDPGGKGYDEKTNIYIAFDPNQIKSSFNRGTFNPKSNNILNQITRKVKEFFSTSEEVKRGTVNITDDQYIISLFETKNFSTLLHELGHVFLNEYSVLAQNTPELSEDFQKIKDWLGAEGEFKREHHEKFAKGFERYLAEGKAPTRELKSAFRRFKNWLLNVYQKARNIGVELTPEIRDVFDRMFTTRQDAFDSAKTNNMDVWTDSEMDALAVLPDDRKYMRDLYKAAIEKADEEVSWRRNKDRINNNAKWKEEAKREVDSKPVYVALSSIEKGPGLNKFAVENIVGTDYLNRLVERYGKSFIKEGSGEMPEEVAALSGFKTPYEMFHALSIAEGRDVEYQKELKKKQVENDSKYQVEDYLTDSKEWEEFMRLKSSYLKKAEGLPSQVPPTKAFRKFAEDQLNIENVREAIANKRYLSNASKYSRLESQKLRSNNIAEASKANQIARLNFIKADIATKNREFFNKAIKGIKTLQKSKSASQDSLYQINDLSARFGLSLMKKGEKLNNALERIRSSVPVEDFVPIYDWAQKKIDAGYDIQLPAIVLDGTVKDYRELTWGQFEQLKEAFDQIKTVDRQERYFTAFEKAVTMEEARNDLLGQLHKSYKEKDISKRDELGVEKFIKGVDAWTTKIETVLRMIDGGEINGTWWQYFIKPIQVAENEEADRMRVIRKDLRELFKKTDISDSMFKKIFTDGMPRPLTKAQILSVGLNWGAEDNRRKLMDGWGWDENQTRSILDNLTKEDWDFVQGVWDYIDSFREESFAVAKEMTGKRPKRVEPSPVETKYGQYKGGYYPLAYDPRKSLRTAQNVQKGDLKTMFQKSYSAPNTKPGSHIERTALAGGQKPLLDLGVIPDHIFDVVHDITHRKAVVNVAKLARDSEVQDAMVKTIGIDTSKQFMDWLADISNEQSKPSSPLHRFAGWARRGTTIVNMGLKMTTIVQQFVGATQSIDEIGPVAFARGMNLFFGSGGLADLGKRGDFIRGKSGMMRNRLLSFDRDIRDATKAITPIKKFRADVTKAAFLGIGLSQWYGVDAPTWMGAYDKYIRENQGKGLTELDNAAVDYADSVVRQTQGGGATKDLSKIQRGDELMRLFTMFYSYFNVLYNLGKLRISQTAKGQRSPVAALASTALLWFIPATLSELVSARGPKDDEDVEDWALPLIGMYPFQSVVGLRDVSNAIGSGFGYQLTPAESSVKNLIWLSKDVWDALSEGETEGLAEKAVESSGYLAPIPSKQLSIWLFNSYDLLTGEDDELNYSDLLRRNRK
jgi:hypothetical protein